MPHISTGLHGMDDVELSLDVFAKGGSTHFATINLNVTGDPENNWTLFFRDIESIRQFRNRLNAAIIEYDTRNAQLTQDAIDAIDKAMGL